MISNIFKLIHLSDLHIGLSKNERLNTIKIFTHIANNYPGITVIITGDIIDNGLEREMKSAGRLIDKLIKTNPVIICPGNHDYAFKGNLFIQPDARINWRKYIDKSESIVMDYIPLININTFLYRNNGICYFSIDSADPKDIELFARGYISKEQAKGLKKELVSNKDNFRIAILHHHPFTEGYFTELEGSKELLEAIEGNCELLLFGHEHEYGLWWNKLKIPLIVSSHKSTVPISGDCLAITIIEKNKDKFIHRLELI